MKNMPKLQQTFLSAVAILVWMAGGAPWIQCCRAEKAFFMGLGDLPGGDFSSTALHISIDGTIVVGSSSSAAHSTEAFRWTRETGMVGLGAIGALSNATRISDDGSTIIGATGDNLFSSDGTISRTYRWTADTGMTLLPTQFDVLPRGINGDGSIIVGTHNWWSATDGVHAPMSPMTNLYDVSSDGNLFTGYHLNGHSEAWSLQDGLIDLTPMTDPKLISADGKVIVGYGVVPGSSVHRGMRWTKQTGAVFLDPTPDGFLPDVANGVSADGAVVVGGAYPPGPPGNSAYIWDTTHGTRNLRQVLVNDYGLGQSLAGWNLRGDESSVSGDGRTIVGRGFNPAGQQEAWIAYLGTPVPEPTTLAQFAAVVAILVAKRHSLAYHIG